MIKYYFSFDCGLYPIIMELWIRTHSTNIDLLGPSGLVLGNRMMMILIVPREGIRNEDYVGQIGIV